MAPFLTSDQVEERWRSLTAGEKHTVEDILTAADTAIREAFTTAGFSEFPSEREAAARVVVLDIVKVSLATGAYAGHSSYTRVEGPRTKSGTLTGAGGHVDLTDWHRKILGLPVGAQPVWNFPRNDY